MILTVHINCSSEKAYADLVEYGNAQNTYDEIGKKRPCYTSTVKYTPDI